MRRFFLTDRVTAAPASLALAILVAGGASVGCTPQRDTCPVGAERCACTQGGSCDKGLTCLSNICVMATAPAREDARPAPPDAATPVEAALPPPPPPSDAGSTLNFDLPVVPEVARGDGPGPMLPDLATPRDMEAPRPMDAAAPTSLRPPNAPFLWRYSRNTQLETIAPDGWRVTFNTEGTSAEPPAGMPGLSSATVYVKEAALTSFSCAAAVRRWIEAAPEAKVRDGKIHPKEDAQLDAWAFAESMGIFATFACHVELLANNRVRIHEGIMLGDSYATLDEARASFLLRTMVQMTGPVSQAPLAAVAKTWTYTAPDGKLLGLLEMNAQGGFSFGQGHLEDEANAAFSIRITSGYFSLNGGIAILRHDACQAWYERAKPTPIKRPLTCNLQDVPLALRLAPLPPVPPAKPGDPLPKPQLSVSGLPLSFLLDGQELLPQTLTYEEDPEATTGGTPDGGAPGP